MEVLASPSTSSVDRCVDIFLRPGGTFGFEEFRPDPEDRGAWTPVAYFSAQEYDSEQKLLPRPEHVFPGSAPSSTEAVNRHPTATRRDRTAPPYAGPKVVSGDRQSVDTKRCAISQRSPTGTKRSR